MSSEALLFGFILGYILESVGSLGEMGDERLRGDLDVILRIILKRNLKK
jgi:hypothetical protein